MSKRAKQWGMALALAVAFSLGLAGLARAAQQDEQQLLDTFRKGVTYYETGEYDKAKQAFSQVLAMNPGLNIALKMRQGAELQEFVKMRDNPQVGKEADQLLDLMMRAMREAKRDVTNVGQALTDFRSGDVLAYGKASVELKSHGPYIVPLMVELLALDEPADQVTVGRAVALLASLQPDAVLPLSAVLTGTDNSLVRTRIAGVLGQIGDQRAVPALMQVWASPATLPNTREAAAQALHSITGKDPAALASVPDQFLDLGRAYLYEDTARVGYTYGMSADVWTWDAAGKDWPEEVTYEQVPAFLYYQRMATDTALLGLAVDPADADLQSLLGAALVRQLALCTYYKSADAHFGAQALEESVRTDAAGRADKLAVQVPMVLSLMQTPQVSGALALTLEAPDGPASLYLVKAVDGKLAASGGQIPDQATVEALAGALDSGDKDVRYNAGVTLVKACPTGECGSADQTMAVMGAAVRRAAERTALIIMRDFQTMNTLISVVRGSGVATTEVRPEEHLIDYTLSLDPAVDIVFLTGNVSDSIMARMMQLLQSDVRTKAAPIYVVVDPTQPAADLAPYKDVQQVLTIDHIRPAVIDPILKEKVLAESRSAFTDQEEALVLKAVRALDQVDPRTTKYAMAQVEPGLISAVSGYSDEVTAAVLEALRKSGSAACLPALRGVVSADKPAALKIDACEAIAAVLKRTGGPASEDTVAALKATLATDDQELRRAAAEALSVAGLSPADELGLVHSEALGK